MNHKHPGFDLRAFSKNNFPEHSSTVSNSYLEIVIQFNGKIEQKLDTLNAELFFLESE